MSIAYRVFLCYNTPMSLLNLFKNKHEKTVISYKPIIASVASFEPEMQALSDADFPIETNKLKEQIKSGKTLDEVLPRAYALVRESARRVIGQRHYDEQLIGGIAIHRGMIAEMRTGEGKTLVATLPAYLHAITGLGVHIVTVNDYLARRDATWMGQIFSFLGVSTSVINGQQTSYIYDASHSAPEDKNDNESFMVVYEKLRPCTRTEAYLADITYGTNSEFGFDYLRDNLVYLPEQRTQRGHIYAIVDEIDSILIDEARTPLIISSEAEKSDELYKTSATIAKKLQKEVDYTIDEKVKAIQLTNEGINHVEELLGVTDIYTEKGIKYVHHIETAVRAHALYIKDKDYVVKNGEVIIVDPFTGRMQPGRRWSEGLHQAVEAKESVKIENETRSVASITYQNYFRFYKTLGGMTGTAETSAEEFYKVYKLDVLQIPTHLPVKRIDHVDQIFQTEQGKFKAIADKVKELQTKGQPVLIGTVSIEKSEMLSAYLHQSGVAHTVLNAKNHEKEGEIIAQSGRKGSVVVATNMAGRGVDIMLGGKPSTKEQGEEIRNLGGLFVLGTERHEARRIDNQLRGRSGRQGDMGETVFYVSLEDDLMRIFGGEKMKSMMGRFGIPEETPIENKIISRTLENAQAKIEGFHFDARKSTLEYDDVLNTQRTAIYNRRNSIVEGDRAVLTSYIESLSEIDERAPEIVAGKVKEVGEDAFFDVLRRILLTVTDNLWVEHLETMDYMRSSVNLRAYGQRDPLIEYKKEGLRLFKSMEASLKAETLNLIETIRTQQNQG